MTQLDLGITPALEWLCRYGNYANIESTLVDSSWSLYDTEGTLVASSSARKTHHKDWVATGHWKWPFSLQVMTDTNSILVKKVF